MHAAFRHHEAGPRRVERARRLRRILVLRDEAAHRAEPGQDQRMDARLGAAGENRVGRTAPNQLGALAHGMGARCAGGHRRVVRAAKAERDRDLTARGVDEHARDEERRHTVGSALPEDVRLLHDPRQVADRRADDDADTSRIHPVDPGVAPGFLCRPQREEDVPAHPSSLLVRGDRGRVEALHLARDPDRELARVEGLDEVDAALAGDRGTPRRRRVEADRRDRTQPGDGDPSHRAILVIRS